jgi:hypothetical protein
MKVQGKRKREESWVSAEFLRLADLRERWHGWQCGKQIRLVEVRRIIQLQTYFVKDSHWHLRLYIKEQDFFELKI